MDDIKTLFENNGYLSSALAKAEAEIERLRAEIERLRAAIKHAYGPSGEVSKLQAEVKRLRAALQRLVTDYEDVPDPTDADGQAVFEDARRALEPKP